MRLTNVVKDKIIQAALNKAGLIKEQEAVVTARAEWAEKARVLSLGAPEEEIEATLAEMRKLAGTLPNGVTGYLNFDGYASNHIYCIMAGQGWNVYFNGQPTSHGHNHVRKLSNNNGIKFTANHEMAIEWEALLVRWRASSKAIDDLRKELIGVMTGINTSKQLLEVWPEAIALLPPEPKKSKNTLPSVQVDSLNKAIGLPDPEMLHES